jgi:hypothetical protein
LWIVHVECFPLSEGAKTHTKETMEWENVATAVLVCDGAVA